MKTTSVLTITFVLAAVCFQTNVAVAQTNLQDEVTFEQWNLGGPRLGITYVPGNGKLSQTLHDKAIGSTLSQFGWQFEYQVVPDGGDPSFVVQFVPLIAAVEYGTLIFRALRLPWAFVCRAESNLA
jgi:hypothetical protein